MLNNRLKRNIAPKNNIFYLVRNACLLFTGSMDRGTDILAKIAAVFDSLVTIVLTAGKQSLWENHVKIIEGSACTL